MGRLPRRPPIDYDLRPTVSLTIDTSSLFYIKEVPHGQRRGALEPKARSVKKRESRIGILLPYATRPPLPLSGTRFTISNHVQIIFQSRVWEEVTSLLIRIFGTLTTVSNPNLM